MKSLQEVIEDLGYETEKYSGRGMCGKHCLGVRCRHVNSTIAEIAIEYTKENIEDRCSPILKWEFDLMGIEYIIYFPTVEYKEAKRYYLENLTGEVVIDDEKDPLGVEYKQCIEKCLKTGGCTKSPIYGNVGVVEDREE